jgi:hypothetical protein
MNDYAWLRNELAKTTVVFSRKITSFALLEELTDIQGLFCYSFEELFLYTDGRLLVTSRLVLAKTKEYLVNIREYGISHTAISNFQNIIDQFSSLTNDKNISDRIAEDARKPFPVY